MYRHDGWIGPGKGERSRLLFGSVASLQDDGRVFILQGAPPSASEAGDLEPAQHRSSPQPEEALTSRARHLVARRCWQLLHGQVTVLEHDLALLAADEGCDASEAEMYVQLLQHYRQV